MRKIIKIDYICTTLKSANKNVLFWNFFFFTYTCVYIFILLSLSFLLDLQNFVFFPFHFCSSQFKLCFFYAVQEGRNQTFCRYLMYVSPNGVILSFSSQCKTCKYCVTVYFSSQNLIALNHHFKLTVTHLFSINPSNIQKKSKI